MKQLSQGFTLLELLVVILLMAMMTTLAIPSFIAFGERNALSAAVNQLQSALAFARNTAITQRIEVTVCPADDDRENCTNDWENELLVIAGDKRDGLNTEDILRVFPALNSVDVTYNRRYRAFHFNTLGHIETYIGSLYICPHGAEQGSRLVMSWLGRTRIEEQSYDCSSE
nr:GspH/FimT family pseudopilin [uncultured Halomonas sp.]